MEAPKKPTVHSMKRRSFVHEYSYRGFYHITISVAADLRQPLGRVCGDIDKADGGYSEDMGYSLYKSMQYIRFLENMELEGLDKLSPERREQVLASMIEMMSIDIMADEHTYTWAEFSDDLYVFRGSRAAEKAFERIKE